MATKRVLWSESGGYCQDPKCATVLFANDSNIDFAEMAHIVAATTNGPRDMPVVTLSATERAHHSNIAVLCANCHTIVDKDPDSYPVAVIRQWKARHQKNLKIAFGTPEFATRKEARAYIKPLLDENRTIHALYGPKEGVFSEERAGLWRRHVVASVIANNAAVSRALKQNRNLLHDDEREIADQFAIHVDEFEARHLLHDWSAETLRFPHGMDKLFEGDA